MPLENRITRESYPTKGTMSLILQESYRPRILSSLSCKCFCMLDLIGVSKEVLYLTVNLLLADFFSLFEAAAELEGDDSAFFDGVSGSGSFPYFCSKTNFLPRRVCVYR